MRRALGILVAVIWIAVVAVLTAPDFFRVERLVPIAQIIAFRGVIVLALAAVGIVALFASFARSIRPLAVTILIVALVGVVANGAVLLGRGIGTEGLPTKTDTAIRVMTWNTAGPATSADEIARLAVAMDADIVALPETTIETGEQVAIEMRELGHPMWAHHAKDPSTPWDAGSTTLLITPDLGDYAVIESSVEGTSTTSTVPSAVAMPVSGVGPIVVAAHAVAPRADYMEDWRADLRWLGDQCAADNVIMAGDFNATLDHFGGLGVDGGELGRCRDAAAASGTGAVGTWSTAWPPLFGTAIDHVMTTDAWTVTGSLVLSSVDSSGSDHRPLVVQLEPAAP